jgi:hypothetical protein
VNTLLNTATILSLLLGVVIPHVSALVSGTKVIPKWAGGYVTLVLAGLTGFLTEWSQTPNHYDWKHGALNAGTALVFAFLTHVGALTDTPLQAKFLSIGAPRFRRAPRKSVT